MTIEMFGIGSAIKWLSSFLSEEERRRLREDLKKECASSIGIETSVVTYDDIAAALKPISGTSYTIKLDQKYTVVNGLEGLKKIITNDWIDKKNYVPEFFDCDDFASAFYAHCRENYNYTGVIFAMGAILDKDTSNVEGYHAYNILAYKDNGGVKCILFEPQTDVLDEDGDLIIGAWKYDTKQVML